MKNFEKGKLIGEGGEQTVYEDNLHADRVIKVRKDEARDIGSTKKEISPEYQKASYYLSKILHMLYPEHFPNIVETDARDMTVVQERVGLDEEHRKNQKLEQDYKEFYDGIRQKYKMRGRVETDLLTENEKEKLQEYQRLEDESTHRLAKLQKPFWGALKEAGVLQDAIDDGPMNFAESSSGKLIYLDNVEPWINASSKKTLFNPEKLRSKINELPEPQKTTALQYLERIMELFELEKKNNINTDYE